MAYLTQAEEWARRHPLRVADVDVTVLLVRLVRGFEQARVMGLAAEMAYYAVLSVFPLIGALGVSLGFLQALVGEAAVERLEAAVITLLHTIFSVAVMSEVVTPMVQGLLRQERTGYAVGSLLIALVLASRVFRSAIVTLDSAYRVEERRGFLAIWGLGFLFALGAIVTTTATLSMVVVGPLLGGGRVIADRLGLGWAFELVWNFARWPVVLAIAVGFLVVLYRTGPNVRNTWRQSLPGAAFGVVGLILVAVGFRLYLETVGVETVSIRDAEEAVAVAGQVVGAFMAALLWLWLSAMVVLSGGVLNAELSRLRNEVPPQKA